jgi:hypothetical protein
MSLSNNQRKVFLKEFFNNNLFREFRILNPNTKLNRRFFLRRDTDKEVDRLFSRVLSCDDACNNIYAELYGFRDMEEQKKHQNKKKGGKQSLDSKPVRVYDRLYFDFDLSSPVIKELKEKINNAIRKCDKKLKKDLLEEYHSLLLDGEIASKPFIELQKLYNYLIDKDIQSFPVFSGSKGFHLYIFFTPILFDPDGFNNVALAFFNYFKSTLGLETLDGAVFLNPSQRISRIPYTRHPITELHTYPVAIGDSYEAVIFTASAPEINGLDINKHANGKGNIGLSGLIKSRVEEETRKLTILKEKDKKIRELHEKRRVLTRKKSRIYGKNNKNYKEIEKDCRMIAKEFLGSPKGEYGEYVTYNCPFHSDKHPSMSVYKERFYCAVCGYKLNYLDFIMKHEGVDKKEAIKILLSHF